MKRILLVFSSLFILGASTVSAQQDKLITHFIFDKMSLNPGATGVNGGICGTSIYRNQWDKVNGAPNSAVLNVEADLTRYNYIPVRFGIAFFHDAIGFTRQNNVVLNLAYPIFIPGAGELSVGVGVGMINVGMNPQWVTPTGQPDPSLPVGFSDMNLDLNFGLYFKGTSDYYAGISSTHLSASVLEDPNGVTYNSARHYYAMGGKKFVGLFGSAGDLDANVLLRSDLVKFSADINARYMWEDKLYGGLTYRLSDAVAVMAGVRPFTLTSSRTAMDNLLIGYSYDITVNKLSSISRGSHEVLLKYCYYLPPIPIQKAKHPRWL